ncbi:MAG TPA: HAD-IA family hydrolase [Firmicutes bacterium]|nr:HAD-IA family hydrolase [Bacillota bacterium]
MKDEEQPAMARDSVGLFRYSRLARLKNIIFDLDGTLVDSNPGILRALNYALLSAGYEPFSENDVRHLLGYPLHRFLDGRVREEDMERVVIAYRDYYNNVQCKNTAVFPGVPEALRRLREAGLKCAIASNKPRYSSINLLDALDIRYHFSVIVGADCVPAPKPDPAMILQALSDLGGTPEDTIYVGDSVVDILAGRDAGLEVFILLNGERDSTYSDKLRGATMILPEIGELVDLVLEHADIYERERVASNE